MGLIVQAPVTGTVCPLSAVPDPVFAQEMVGPGLAIEPDSGSTVEVLSPLDGRILTLHPHAVVILSEALDPQGGGRHGVLVHVGIDTVRLKGSGFTVHVRAGEAVAAGQPMISVDPVVVHEAGYSLLVPVIAMEAPSGALDQPAEAGTHVEAGDRLYTWH